MLTEEQVYLGTKKWLIKQGFRVLAGQPARGTDQLPVIEIKQSLGNKGSKNSYKPDLFVYGLGTFYIIECKPAFDYSDCEKIWDILNSVNRIDALYEECEQYHLFSKIDYVENLQHFRNHIKGIVSYSPPFHPQMGINHIVVSSWMGEAEYYEF